MPKPHQAQREPTPLETLELECAGLARQIEAQGLSFQLPGPAILEIALVTILTERGICTQEEWRLTVAGVKRDMLAKALAEVSQVKARLEAESRMKQLVLPEHVQKLRDLQH